MIQKINQYRFASNGSTVLNNFTKNMGSYPITPNFKSFYKKIYYEVYIYHRDSSRDHSVYINLLDGNTNDYIFSMYQFQVNHSSSISSSESGLGIYAYGLDGHKYKYYGVPRHPVYGIGYDFTTGTFNIYNGTNSIIFSVSSGISIDNKKSMYFQAYRMDGNNSGINLTYYFGDTGFNYGIPEGYHAAYEEILISPTYEKDNEMFIG